MTKNIKKKPRIENMVLNKTKDHSINDEVSYIH